MTTPDTFAHVHRFRAPTRHGELLIEPPLASVDDVLRANVERLGSYRCDLQGRGWRELAVQARHDLLRRARRYVGSYATGADGAELHSDSDELPGLVLAGHQPQLFHPGVWTKHFVLGRVARAAGVTAVNLLIDNDIMRGSAMRVPGGTVLSPRMDSVPLDEPRADVPYEERAIRDFSQFRSFGDRAAQAIADLVPDPLLRQLWPMAIEAANQRGNLGRCVAQARHRLEMQWGLNNLEVPLGEVCRSEPFRWFAVHLLAQLPRFWNIHNAALAEYRQLHRLRSRSHPVPELSAVGAWLEAPFWVWQSDQPRRRRVFARLVGNRCELTDRGDLLFSLPLPADGDGAAAVDQLDRLAQQGIKLRPRALITTMYARLFLSDLFLHGIGGAKYDELTDVLVQRFFDLPPPYYMIVSGTFQLPISRPNITEEDLRRIDHQLRELRFHPDRYVDLDVGDSNVAALVESKQRWIAAELSGSQRRQRHESIEYINGQLQTYVASERGRLLRERRRLVELLRRDALLNSREFSFCLFPAQTLKPYLLEVLQPPA